ncbi:HPF/RaiA family ribosome-associated protein [Kitasatospora purpeofusca]|uniref:HPF/RaiA family ribosome-associated protein n=1 Tax=Kitasatospora purpeofusca TaxID=67352 RepID=UPI00366583F2
MLSSSRTCRVLLRRADRVVRNPVPEPERAGEAAPSAGNGRSSSESVSARFAANKWPIHRPPRLSCHTAVAAPTSVGPRDGPAESARKAQQRAEAVLRVPGGEFVASAENEGKRAAVDARADKLDRQLKKQ